MKISFIGVGSVAIRRLLKSGIISSGVLIVGATILMVIPKLFAVQWIVNSQSVSQAETNAVVTAQLRTVTNQYVAYAQVEPIAVLPVRPSETGVMSGLDIAPGTAVHEGQKLAELRGPEIQSALKQAEAAAHSAQTDLQAARKSLAIEKQQLASRLVTRQMLLQTESAAALAQSSRDTAEARLKALQQTILLKAPSAGTVLAVDAADGERVSIGETILTIQPAQKLWLKADFYGSDVAKIHAGMTGNFLPANGGEPVPVTVTTVFGALAPDGGVSVGLVAAKSSPRWLNGEFGKVTLNGTARSMTSVPTRSLILDKGKWWVLVQTPQGNRRHQVRPGPTCGWQTFIEHGLRPGDQVVVENAYLEFHRNISKSYQPPD